MKEKSERIVKSAIGLRTKNELRVITVEQDSNPAFAGAILYAKYQDAEKVKGLIDLGDVYLLREQIEPESACCHYVLKSGCLVKEVHIQEYVTVAKSRDVRQIDSKGVIKKSTCRSKARVYRHPLEVYWGEQIDKLYLFDEERGTWETWGIPYNSQCFMELKIGYRNLIKNLVYRRDITPLSRMEKENLKYIE